MATKLVNSNTGKVRYEHVTAYRHTHRTAEALNRCAAAWVRKQRRLDKLEMGV